jgi:hypothetical protein
VIQGPTHSHSPIYSLDPITCALDNRSWATPTTDWTGRRYGREACYLVALARTGLTFGQLRSFMLLILGFGIDWGSRPRLLGVKPLLAGCTSATLDELIIHATDPHPTTDRRIDEDTDTDTDATHRDEHQIQLDTQRSFVFYPVGNTLPLPPRPLLSTVLTYCVQAA